MNITQDNFDKVRDAFGRFNNALRLKDSASKRFDNASEALSIMRKRQLHTDDDFLMAGRLVAMKRRADKASVNASNTMVAIRDSITQ